MVNRYLKELFQQTRNLQNTYDPYHVPRSKGVVETRSLHGDQKVPNEVSRKRT